MSATAWAFIDRRKVAIVSLLLALAGYASLGVAGGSILPAAATPKLGAWLNIESHPAPSFYVAVVVVWSPKRYSNERA